MTQNFDRSKTKYTIKAVFHGAMGYMLLNDAAYNKARKSDKGNPFKDAIADLQKSGESSKSVDKRPETTIGRTPICSPVSKLMQEQNLRITQLVQDGYVQLQP